MTTRLPLFDDMKRTATSSRQRNEPFFAYLNRSAHREATRIRGRLESWFKRFPVEARDDVRGRFRGDDDQDHRGAVFELFIHELLTRIGCMVEVHPDIPGTKSRPDFLARHGDCLFYVEATVVDPSESPFAPNPLEEDAVAKINELTSPHFYIFAEARGKLSTPLSREKVTRPFAELLDAHDPNDIQRLIDRDGPFAAPSQTITCGSWSLQGWLEPIAPERRGDDRSRTLVIGPARTGGFDSSTPIQRAVKKKASKYGRLDAPLVVAANVRDPFSDKDAEMEVLFGKEQITYFEERPDFRPKLGRKPDGVWIQGGYQPRYTRLSAVLRSRLKTLNVAAFERAYSYSSHIQVSPQTLNRKACMMSTPRMQYATDLTDGQWQRIEPLLPAPRWRLHGPGRPPRNRRQIVNGLLYLNKTGYLVVLGRGKRGMITFVAGACKGSGHRCWIS